MNEHHVAVYPPEHTDSDASRAQFVQAVATFCLRVAERELTHQGHDDARRPLCA